jgi:hypothetical protein
MAARDRLRRFARLPGGKTPDPGRRHARGEGLVSINEEMQPGTGVAGREARVVGRPFVPHRLPAGDGVMHDKACLVPKERAEGAGGLRGFDRAVELGGQIGRGEVHAAVGGVRGRSDRGGIGHPHARSRTTRGEQTRGLPGGRLQNRRVIASPESEPAQHVDRRPFMGRQHGLRHAEVGEGLHLRQPLQCGRTRVRPGSAVRHGRQVAVGETRIRVSGADQAVEIDFACAHGCSPGGQAAGRLSSATSMLATG